MPPTLGWSSTIPLPTMVTTIEPFLPQISGLQSTMFSFVLCWFASILVEHQRLGYVFPQDEGSCADCQEVCTCAIHFAVYITVRLHSQKGRINSGEVLQQLVQTSCQYWMLALKQCHAKLSFAYALTSITLTYSRKTGCRHGWRSKSDELRMQ